MGQHEGRLNESESRIWDRCYRYFVRTGKWIFEEALKRKENKMGMTDGENIDMEDVPVDKNKDTMLNFHNVLGGKPCKITDEALFDIDNPEHVNGLMYDPSKGRHPYSTDFWLECHTFLCERSGCAANKKSFGKGKCTMPSLIAIDSHGRCTGYHPRNKKNWKNTKKI